MPATNEPTPVPAPKRDQPEPPGRPVWLKFVFFLSLIVFGGAILYYLNRPAPVVPVNTPAVVKLAPVEKGNVEYRLRIVGATTALNYAALAGPQLRGPDSGSSMVLLRLAESGKIVKKGDIVAEIDPQSAQDHIDDTIAGLRDRENDVKKKQIQQELDMENLRQSVRVAKATLDKAKLDFSALEVRTVVDQELLKLAVDEAEAAYKQISSELVLREQSQKADMKITAIARDLEVAHVKRHEVDILRYVIRSPIDGMVVIETMNRPGGDRVQVAPGDRVHPGMPFMKIVNTSKMLVNATVNQAEGNLFKLGQSATVNLDAFPGAKFTGRIDSIGALAVSGFGQNYYIRTLPVRVVMTSTDSRVIPDLSASADVLLEKVENVLTVPLSAVSLEKDQAVVQVKSANGFQKRTVKTGLSDGVKVAVLEGLKQGEQVLIN
jgi:biotin carboxyl carrier protein